MPRTRLLVFALAAFALAALSPSHARGDDPKPDATKDAPKKEEGPPTVAAEKGPFTVLVEGSGVFEAIGAVEVSCEPEVYGGELKVVESSLASGPIGSNSPVILVRFDTEKIDEQLAFAEKDLEIARRSLAQRHEESKRSEEGASLTMARAEKDKAAADEALDSFNKIDRELRVKESEYRLQGTRDGIRDQEEELAQLKKMYKADDVVEETEEIVMKRAERGLGRSKAWLGFQEQHHKDMVEVELPRELVNLDLGAKRATFELDRLRATSPIQLEQGRIDLAKAEITFAKQESQFAKLKADRERFTILAPAAGIAIPGSLVRGKWSGIEETTRALAPGEVLRAKQPIFTIVTQGRVSFRTAVPEASIRSVKLGQSVEIACAALGDDAPVKGKVSRVALASGDGNYEVGVEVVSGAENVMPGYTGKSKVTTAEKASAVTVPAACVVVDGDKKSVHVWADGKSAPRAVKTGATSGGRTEILDGLEGGEKVLTSPPKP